MFDDKPTSDHRANIVEKPGEKHLENVNDDKANERKTGDEMDRPHRLATSEDGEQPRKGGIDRRRHREPGQHDQRRHDEQDTRIGQLLKGIIPLGFLPAGCLRIR